MASGGSVGASELSASTVPAPLLVAIRAVEFCACSTADSNAASDSASCFCAFATDSFYVYSTFNSDENSFCDKHLTVKCKVVRRTFSLYHKLYTPSLPQIESINLKKLVLVTERKNTY